MGGVGCIIGAILYFYIIYRCRHRGREVISMKEREQVEEMLEMKNMSEGEDPDENTKSFYVIWPNILIVMLCLDLQLESDNL